MRSTEIFRTHGAASPKTDGSKRSSRQLRAIRFTRSQPQPSKRDIRRPLQQRSYASNGCSGPRTCLLGTSDGPTIEAARRQPRSESFITRPALLSFIPFRIATARSSTPMPKMSSRRCLGVASRSYCTKHATKPNRANQSRRSRIHKAGWTRWRALSALAPSLAGLMA